MTVRSSSVFVAMILIVLRRRDFEAIREWLSTGLVKVELKNPLPHQEEALQAIRDISQGY